MNEKSFKLNYSKITNDDQFTFNVHVLDQSITSIVTVVCCYGKYLAINAIVITLFLICWMVCSSCGDSKL